MKIMIRIRKEKINKKKDLKIKKTQHHNKRNNYKKKQDDEDSTSDS